MKNCRTCGASFDPSERQLRKRDYLCHDCKLVYEADYRARRKRSGRPIPHSKLYYYRPHDEGYRAAKRVSDAKRRRDPAYQQRLACRNAFNYAVLSGKIKRQPCSVCGNPNAEGHHEDYSNPFEVIWLCRKDHEALHHVSQRGADVGPDTPSDRVRKPDHTANHPEGP